MKTVEINLEPQFWRPTIRLYGKLTLIDTGAVVPVISMEKELLNLRFKAKLVKERTFFTGFGGVKNWGDVYSLSNFYIHELHFKTLECFAPYEFDKDFPIILSAPLFNDVKYEIDPKENKVTLKVPNDKLMNNEFLITNLSDKICVQMNGVMLNG